MRGLSCLWVAQLGGCRGGYIPGHNYLQLRFTSNSTQFCRYHRLELRQLPSKFGGVWLSTSKVINAKHWANVVTTSAERFSLISQSILNRFTCNFAHTIRSHCGDCPEKFGDVWSIISKVFNVMHWNNTVSTSPERWKCGPSLKQHWGSALPPSYMCDWAVRTDKAGRQDWESNYQHYIDIGPISFFFFFFVFKIWYLAKNKREKIVFPKYPLLREM